MNPVDAAGLLSAAGANAAAAVQAAPAKSAVWNDLLADASLSMFSAAWLDQLRAELPQARRCIALLRLEGDQLQLAAANPAGVAVDDLLPALTQAAACTQADCMAIPGGLLLTQPLLWRNEVRGLLAVEVLARSVPDLATQRLAWGAGWMMALVARLAQHREMEALTEARRLLPLIATASAEPRFEATCLTIANQLATSWQAEGVAIGWVERQQTRVVARANAAQNDARANLVQQIASAMDEAIDGRQTLQFPPPAAALPLPEHQAYARETSCPALTTALLFDDGVAVGAVLLERRTPLSPAEVETLDTQCMMLAPLLVQRRAADRSLWQHAKDSARQGLHRLGDDSLLGWKVGSALAALLLLIAALLPIPFRITASSVVEGEVQRSLAAPFQGFVREAFFRAGDVVRAGQVIATLDDRDLRLESAKWQSELEVAQRKEREAMAGGNRVEMRLAAAQGNQARAQLALAEEKLRRVQISAPFDGVIVRGDLSQQLGAPVEQGKPLFEIAPLTAWRVILRVDERDVLHVKPQQTGELVLTGMAGLHLPFIVKRVTAVAVAEDGRNHFRIEAELTQQEQELKLRPGMEGVGKVDAGSASALWIATRRLVDWLRLTVWELSP